jgi:hypothetical protein
MAPISASVSMITDQVATLGRMMAFQESTQAMPVFNAVALTAYNQPAASIPATAASACT